MGAIGGCDQDNRIMSLNQLEEEIAKYTPRLFFDITDDHPLGIIIEVPKQIIPKIQHDIVPRVTIAQFVRVVERGKKDSIKNKFWKWFDKFTR